MSDAGTPAATATPTSTTVTPSAARGEQLWLAVCLLLMPCAGAAVFSLRNAPAPPLQVTTERTALVFSEYLIHFGERPVPPQPILTPTFVFRNTGTETVRIEKLVPSCGCLKPEVTTSVLAPGATGRLTVPIRTATEQPGFHEYTVNVRYTDSKPREVTLTVKVVLPEHSVTIEPKALFLMGKFGDDIEHQVRVSDLRAAPLSVQSVTASGNFLTPRIISQTRDSEGNQAVIGVKVSEQLPAGNQRALIHVHTSDPAYAVLQVPLLLRSRERPADQAVQVRPELLNMAARVQSAEPAIAEVTFPRTWTISHVDAFPLELDVRYDPPEQLTDQQRLKLEVRFSQLPTSALQHGVVTIVANNGADMISVPLQFAWSPAAPPQQTASR